MTHPVEILPKGQTVFRLAHSIFGEEYDRLVATHRKARVTVVVIDTNILINDVKHSLLKAPLTSLMEAARIGALRLFASTTVRDEVWEKLGDETIVRKLKIDSVEARQRWMQSYLPWITFLDPGDLPLLSARVELLQTKDPDDVPTGQIIELLRPDVVLCYNTKHLGHFDIIAEGWVRVAVDYRDISRREGIVVGVEFVGTVSVQTAFGVAELSISALAKIDKNVWQILGLIALVTIGIALVHPPTRRWFQTKGASAVSAVKRAAESVGEGIASVAETVATAEEAARKAKQTLALRPERAITSPRRVLEYAAWVLARTSGPLSAEEIMRRMRDAGYQTTSEHPEPYLKKILHSHPGLFHGEDSHWSLGYS
jgi:hypothetical protein